MFKVGDRVECINNDNGDYRLITVGAVYTVSGWDGEWLQLQEPSTKNRNGSGGWNPARFRLASAAIPPEPPSPYGWANRELDLT